MRKVTPVLLDAFPDRVLNLHPALLPSFKGAYRHPRRVRRGRESDWHHRPLRERVTTTESHRGATRRGVREDDTLDDLEARIHEVEHVLSKCCASWLKAA